MLLCTAPGTTVLKVPRAVPDGFQGRPAAYAGDRGLDLAHVPFVGPQNGDSGKPAGGRAPRVGFKRFRLLYTMSF